MSYPISTYHQAVLERDKKRAKEDQFVLRLLARIKTDNLTPLNVSDFSATQCCELGVLQENGWVRVQQNRDLPEWGLVEITDEGLAKIFTESL